MNKISNWFRRFMSGRYGHDKLNSAVLWTGVAVAILAMFIPTVFGLALHMLAYALVGIALFRTFSRNTYKRYQENRKFLILVDRIKDQNHRYFECPRCRQLVRVPKGKGKISFSCPKCKEKFVKKT